MKNVLIITSLFDNVNNVGSNRTRGLFKFLYEFNWNPIILTNDSTKASVGVYKINHKYINDIIKTKMPLNKRDNSIKHEQQIKFRRPLILNKVWDSFILFPDPEMGWIRKCNQAVKKIFADQKIDAIISCSFPSGHILAKKLKDQYSIPWIADFRDPWANNYYLNIFNLRKQMDEKLEKITIKSADAITTISPILSNTLFVKYNIPTYTIYNGFDKDQYVEKPTIENKFSITHTGSLYEGMRDPSAILRSASNIINKLNIKPSDFTIRFIGCNDQWLHCMVKHYGLDNYVDIIEKVNRSRSLKFQQESQILLLINPVDDRDLGTIPAKLFDYLGARRPIISIGPQNSNAGSIINTTKTGYHVSDAVQMESIIERYYLNYKLHNKIEFQGDNVEIEKYSQISMAKNFSDVLRQLTN